MIPWNSPNRRWQFSLGALFGALTLAALLSAALAGAFGAQVRESVMSLATLLLVIGAGLVYYVLFILVICSPIMLAAGCLKLARRFFARRQDKARDGQVLPGQEPAD